MPVLLTILIATTIVSLISLVGIVTLIFKKGLLDRILLVLISFSAGALLGSAFLHLIPEALTISSGKKTFTFTISGILLFLVFEKFLYWRHCHNEVCKVHMFTYLNLVGDGIHNFIDGMIISASFLTSPALGISTVVAIIFHEVPQEMGDFGVLIYGGFSRSKALFYNFISATTAFLGALIGYLGAEYIGNFKQFLLPFAAGGFIYIAAADLFPELSKENKLINSITQMICLCIGVGMMYLFKD